MKEILVIRLSALGDVAMTVPVIYSCATAHPEVRLRVVTTAFCARLFQNAPQNVSVIAVEPREAHGIVGTWRLLRRLHRMGCPDAVADLHNVLRSWIIDASFFLRGCKIEMVDKERRNRRLVLSRKAVATPIISRYFNVFAQLGLPSAPTAPHSPFPASPPIIGIAPFARYSTKTYPLEKMRRVVSLLREQGLQVMLFGSRGKEAEELQTWAGTDSGIVVVAGKYQLEEELALMSRLSVMVTMDSANHHLASLVGLRVISIWGSTTPACGFMAWGQSHSDALVANVHCQPCSIAGSSRCKLSLPQGKGQEATLLCMNSLSPETIAEKVIAAALKMKNEE